MQRVGRSTMVQTGLRAGRSFGLLLLLTIALHAAAFSVDVFNPDETFLGTQARVLQDGGSLYEDTADRKAPIVPFLYTGTFAVTGDDSLAGPRVLAMLALALTALLILIEARARWGARAGWFAGMLCVFVATAFLPGDGQAANFELFMLPATVAAVALARRAKWIPSGVATAFAVLVKQTGGTMLLPVAYLAMRARTRRPVALVAAGFAGPILAAAVLIGFDDYLRWNVFGNGGFAEPPPIGQAVQTFFEQWGIWAGLGAPVVLMLAVAWRDRRRGLAEPDRTGHDPDGDLWLWFLSAVLSVAVGWRFYGHYFLQLAPVSALLVTGAVARRSERVRTLVLASTGAIAFGCAIAAFIADPADIIRPAVTEDVAEAVRAHSRPSDRLFIWGLAPEVYWSADRQPATRFVTTLSFLAGVQPTRDDAHAFPEHANEENWSDFRADFDAHPPRLLLDTSPADLKDAGRAPMRRYPSLRARVEEDYCFLLEVRGMHLYERREGEASPATGSNGPGGPLTAACDS